MSCHLFVSTALDTWSTDQPEMFARDFQINDTCYRRLDPEYFAWLRSRMVLLNAAAANGKVPTAAFDDARVKFNAVQEWAIGHFGERALLDAVRCLRPDEYAPPVAEALEPARGGREQENQLPPGIHPDAIAMVDAIRESAMSLGWKHEALYRLPENRRAVFAANCGLVYYVRTGWRIGEVTRQSIELIGPGLTEVRHRFYNPDVDQPWVIRIDRGEK